MRRVIDEEPPSRAGRWTRRLGVLALLAVGAAVTLSRAGILPPAFAIGVLRAGVVLAALAVLAALVAAVEIWRTGRNGVGALLVGLLLAGAAAAGPLWFAWTMAGRPPFADVSTDLDDTPEFSAAPAVVAQRHGFLHAPPPVESRAVQASAYADLRTMDVELDPADTYAALVKIAKARRWQVLVTSPPRAGAPGRMEAVAHTPVMGFAQDVALRVAASAPGQARVDMRVAGRWTFGDGGRGAALIRSVAADLDAAADE